MKKYLYMFFSLLFFSLGFLGAFLPVLPTVPFLLLSIFCAAKGSKRLEHKIKTSPFYQKHMEAYVEERSMRRGTKVKILVFASLVLLFAFYFSKVFWARILIFLIWITKVIYFIFFIDTKKEREEILYD